jgi:hypothetical protein
MEMLGWGEEEEDGNSLVLESFVWLFTFSGMLVDHVLLLGCAGVVVGFFLRIGIGFNV